MPLRLFKTLLAQMGYTIVLMEQLVARLTMEATVAVSCPLMLFVVNIMDVALIRINAVTHLVVVLIPMGFVVKMVVVAPMVSNVITNQAAVADHIFCLCWLVYLNLTTLIHPWKRYSLLA